MIRKNTSDWYWVIRNFQKSKAKSNRDVLCTECWEVYKYEDNKKHLKENLDHKRFILTAKQYSSEAKFKKISKLYGKYFFNV